MSQVDHVVETTHGNVVVKGKDASLYNSLEQWVKDHQAVISIALSAASIGYSHANFRINTVRRK